MEPSEYQNMYEHEGSHFYYVSLHELVSGLVQKYAGGRPSLKILDAGCGTGMLAKKLAPAGQVKGLDFNKKAVDFASQRGVDAVEGSILQMPFGENSFDIITCMDVLVCQEIHDDRLAMQQIFRTLKPGGLAILRVSAVKWLKLAHDRHVHSIRRYNSDELLEKLQQAGFDVVQISYINIFLLPAVIAQHLKEKIWPPKAISSSIGSVNPLVNRVGRLLCSAENRWLLRGYPLPIGLGLIAVAKKMI